MNKTLVIETASKNLYVLLLDGDKTHKKVLINNQKQHSVILNETINDVLKLANCSLSDIDCFAVGIGVGSFTGIRVGVSIVKAFNLVYNKKLIEVNSLQSLAYIKQGRTNCLMDAGKGWYFAIYDKATQIQPPTLLDDESAELLKNREDTVLFNPEIDYSEQIEAQVRDKLRLKTFCQRLTPLYIRKCQAEEELGK